MGQKSEAKIQGIVLLEESWHELRAKMMEYPSQLLIIPLYLHIWWIDPLLCPIECSKLVHLVALLQKWWNFYGRAMGATISSGAIIPAARPKGAEPHSIPLLYIISSGAIEIADMIMHRYLLEMDIVIFEMDQVNCAKHPPQDIISLPRTALSPKTMIARLQNGLYIYLYWWFITFACGLGRWMSRTTYHDVWRREVEFHFEMSKKYMGIDWDICR